MVLATLVGLLLAIKAVSITVTPSLTVFEGSLIAFFGAIGCIILDKLKARIEIYFVHADISLAE